MRLVRPASPRRSLVLDDELGWDRTPSVENPIPRTAPTEEKGSDVNLASFLLADGYFDRYDAALLIAHW